MTRKDVGTERVGGREMRDEGRDERHVVDSSSTNTSAEQDEKTRKRVTRNERPETRDASARGQRFHRHEHKQEKKRKKNTQ